MGQPNAASSQRRPEPARPQPVRESRFSLCSCAQLLRRARRLPRVDRPALDEPPEEGEESNTSISLLELLNSIKTNMEKQGGLMDLSSLTSIGHSDEYQDKMKIGSLGLRYGMALVLR